MKSRGFVPSAVWLVALIGVVLCAAAVFSPIVDQAAAGDQPSVAPAHRVAAIYFHRTVRCPTCLRISAYIEESVKANFAEELKDGRVAVHMVDFQSPKNQQYTTAYQITGPTLVLADVRDGKVTAWKPASKVWSLVARKDAFFQYVQGEVRGYLEAK